SKSNGKEGKVICVKTEDGGLTWKLLSEIGEEPEGFAIMPSTVRLSKRELLTTIRNRADGVDFISAYYSRSNGRRWRRMPNVVDDTGKGGSPPALIRLEDGRLCLVYAYRSEPTSGRNGSILA